MAVKPVESVETRQMEYGPLQATRIQLEQSRKPLTVEAAKQAADESSSTKWSSEDKKALEEAQESLKKRLETKGVNFEFRLLEQDGGIQVEVRDGKSGTVLQRFPPDSLLKLKDMNIEQAGAFLNQAF